MTAFSRQLKVYRLTCMQTRCHTPRACILWWFWNPDVFTSEDVSCVGRNETTKTYINKNILLLCVNRKQSFIFWPKFSSKTCPAVCICVNCTYFLFYFDFHPFQNITSVFQIKFSLPNILFVFIVIRVPHPINFHHKSSHLAGLRLLAIPVFFASIHILLLPHHLAIQCIWMVLGNASSAKPGRIQQKNSPL